MRNCSCRRRVGTSRTLTLAMTCALCSTATRFLQDQSFFAVAQKKYVFIYDRNGVELHRLKSHVEPTRLEFLPYHWLLASVVSALVAALGLCPNVFLIGEPWVPKIPRHLHRCARSRTPDESGRVPYHDSKSTQRRHPSRPPKRGRVVMDPGPPSSRSAAPRPSWARRGSQRRS